MELQLQVLYFQEQNHSVMNRNIRTADLGLQLLLLSMVLLLFFISARHTLTVVFALLLPLWQFVSHLFYYFSVPDGQYLTRPRRFYHLLFFALLSPMAVMAGIYGLYTWNYEHMLSLLYVMAAVYLLPSLYYTGLCIYELRICLYLQAQAEMVDIGA